MNRRSLTISLCFRTTSWGAKVFRVRLATQATSTSPIVKESPTILPRADGSRLAERGPFFTFFVFNCFMVIEYLYFKAVESLTFWTGLTLFKRNPGLRPFCKKHKKKFYLLDPVLYIFKKENVQFVRLREQCLTYQLKNGWRNFQDTLWLWAPSVLKALDTFGNCQDQSSLRKHGLSLQSPSHDFKNSHKQQYTIFTLRLLLQGFYL